MSDEQIGGASTDLFSDTSLTAVCLRVLADVFAPTSRAFVQDVGIARPRFALALRCGPGSTTRLLFILPFSSIMQQKYFFLKRAFRQMNSGAAM